MILLEAYNKRLSSSEQRRQELEQTNADLMTRIDTEQKAFDAHHEEMIEITQHLEKENDDLKSRLSSVEAGNASISSPDQRREELEQTNANLLMRVQALQAQAGTEHDAYTQMREIANQLQKENADLKYRSSLLEKDYDSSPEQASAYKDTHDAFSYCKQPELEQDTQETQQEEAQQAHEVQKLLSQNNQDLENQVRPDIRVKIRSFAMQDNARKAMQDKKPLTCRVAGHSMPGRLSETSSSVNPASTLNSLCSPRNSRLLGQQLNVCQDRGIWQNSLVSDNSMSLKMQEIDSSSETETYL
jgi:hypothetical protein